MSLTELPEWVWQVVEATQKYDDEHPPLYRSSYTTDGYESTQCLDSILEPLIPAEVWDAARVMRSRREMAGGA